MSHDPNSANPKVQQIYSVPTIMWWFPGFEQTLHKHSYHKITKAVLISTLLTYLASVFSRSKQDKDEKHLEFTDCVYCNW